VIAHLDVLVADHRGAVERPGEDVVEPLAVGRILVDRSAIVATGGDVVEAARGISARMGHAGLQVVGKAPLAHAPDARRARARNGRCSEFHRLPSRRDGAFAERAEWQTTQGDVPGVTLHATTFS
jgi:hypothetical protein